MDLTDAQWEILEPLLPKLRIRDDGKGRPWKSSRDVLNGILWILRTGAPWMDMPGRYPPYATCHRRFSAWVRDGTFRKVVEAIARDLRDRGGLDPEEAFVDGTFAGAKKGGLYVGKTKRGKGTKIMAMVDRAGLPLAVDIESASPHETKLVEGLLRRNFLRRPCDKPRFLIGDKAYDSDALTARLARKGITLIAPHRSNRKVLSQDGRHLRRYKRRWKVERFFSWLFNFRRLVTRYEFHAANFLALINLACAMILLRHL